MIGFWVSKFIAEVLIGFGVILACVLIGLWVNKK